MSEFNDGNWFAVKPEQSNGYVHINSDDISGGCIATCYTDNAEANSRLIAASPEMYDYLTHMIDHDLISDHSAVKELKSLIKRIEGES